MLIHFFVMIFLITCSHVYVYWLIAVRLSQGAWWFHSGIQYPGGGNFASQEELSRSCTRRARYGFDEKPAWNPHENLWLLGNHVHQEILRGLRFNCKPCPLSHSSVRYVDWNTIKQSSDVDWKSFIPSIIFIWKLKDLQNVFFYFLFFWFWDKEKKFRVPPRNRSPDSRIPHSFKEKGNI